MHLFGWVSIHDTYQHMGVFEKNFVVGIFGVWIFGLLQQATQTLAEPLREAVKHAQSAIAG